MHDENFRVLLFHATPSPLGQMFNLTESLPYYPYAIQLSRVVYQFNWSVIVFDYPARDMSTIYDPRESNSVL